MEATDGDVSSYLAIALAKLDTPEKQRKALYGLLEKLSRSQVRELSGLLNRIDFDCDIVGNLPVEITIMIFQHLQFHQVFQARRVSRKWMQVLSSPDILDPLLQQWELMGETSLRIPENLSPQSIRSLKAEHIDAYRTGLAFGKLAYPWDSPTTEVPADIAYSDGILACIDMERRVVSVLYIELGIRYTYVPQNREKMACITVSTSMVAATTLSGNCYIWEIPNGRACSFHLTSVLPHALVSSETTLAVLAESRIDHVTTWNLESQKSYCFPATVRQNRVGDVNEGGLRNEKKIMVDKTGHSVVLFERAVGDPETIYFIRMSLEGYVEASGSLIIPTTDFYVSSPGYLGHARCPTVWFFVQCRRNHRLGDVSTEDVVEEASDLLRVVYDWEQECLRLDHHSVNLLRNNLGDEMSNFTDIVFWKDVAYYRAHASTTGLKVIDLRDDKCRVADMDRWTSNQVERLDFYGSERYGDRDETRFPLLFGDEVYLVNVFAGGVVVWCFDKNITMANEDKGYRELIESGMWKKLAADYKPY